MNRQKALEPWRIALNDLKEKSGMTYKQIADTLNVSEKSVIRVFNGDAKNPGLVFVGQIIGVLGGSTSVILGEAGAVIASPELLNLQAEYEALKAQHTYILTENDVLTTKNAALTAEIDLLKKELQHKEELLAVHNYYIKKGMTE